MDYLDAADEVAAAAPWAILKAFSEIQVNVTWPVTDGCPAVPFPLVRLPRDDSPGLFGFASASDANSWARGDTKSINDDVIRVSWEEKRAGGGKRPRIAVIAPSLGEDGSPGTLACPPTPSEEAWATGVLWALPRLAREAAVAAGAGVDDPTDIWAVPPEVCVLACCC